MTDINELIAELMGECGLGAVLMPVKPVSGGFLHKMYRVVTERGEYAVKHLSPAIMSRDGVFDSYARAEMLESVLEGANIPIIPALAINGSKMRKINGHCFYIFNWSNGHITDWNSISESQCRAAGNILGRIHAIEPKTAADVKPDASKIDWYGYLNSAKTRESEIFPVLRDNIGLFIYAEREMNEAVRRLPDDVCISDEDMDPKNIMWENGRPFVIDLECLSYGNPVSHALQLSLQWSGITTRSLNIEKTIAFFEGYLCAYDDGFREYADIFGVAYTWVDWLGYNIERALGDSFDDAERKTGVSETINTAARIRYLFDNEGRIKEALNSRLRRIQAT